MSPAGYIVAALLALLLVVSGVLYFTIQHNDALTVSLTKSEAARVREAADAKAAVSSWQAKLAMEQAATARLQKTIADRNADIAIEHLASKRAQANLRKIVEGANANDPNNCLVRPVHTGVDRRLRDAGANMSAPASPGNDPRPDTATPPP